MDKMSDKKKPNFLRKDTFKLSKLGRRRRNRQKWRRARGRHNKIRQKEKGYRREPGIGYCASRKTRGFVKGLRPLIIANMSDLNYATSRNILILSRRLGKKKKMEILNKIREKNFQVYNVK